jgi:hypothetical protein
MLQQTSVSRCTNCNLTYILLGITLGVVLLDHKAVLVSGFGEASTLFSIVVVLIYTPTISFEGSFLTSSLSTFVIVCVLDDSHSNRSEVES